MTQHTVDGPRSPRWCFMRGMEIEKDGRPYLNRLRLVQTPLFSVYLHRIHTPDRDRDPHDHPWWFASLVLSGGYTEYVWDTRNDTGPGVRRVRRRGSLRCMPKSRAHMITEVQGQLWTLVFTGRRTKSWGFWTVDGLVDWRDYEGAVEPPAWERELLQVSSRVACARCPGAPLIEWYELATHLAEEHSV